jgi:glycosyltransferase involved in cell wall biosynthesis
MFILDDFPPITHTSASMITLGMAKRLLSQGHEVFVVASVQNKQREGEEEYEGIRVFRIYSKYHPRWKAYLSLYNPRVVSRLKEIIKTIKPEIVHFHHIHQYLSYYSFKVAKKYAKAVFLTAHDVMLIQYGKLMPRGENYIYKLSSWEQLKQNKARYNPLRNIVIKHYLKYIDKIFSVSNALKNLLEINGIKNIETIYNGIDVDEWRFNEGETNGIKKKFELFGKKVIFFGGRLSGAKGGAQILKALALIKQEMNNIVLLVAGERNKYVEDMEKMIKNLDLKENIIFTGWLDKNHLRAVYHCVDVSVFPSICFETFGMSNLEAMACKKSVVSTNFGGPSEVVIDGETGYLVNPHNTELMAEKIVDLLKNPQKARQFGEAGYKRTKEKFSFSRQIKETLEWYLKFKSSD